MLALKLSVDRLQFLKPQRLSIEKGTREEGGSPKDGEIEYIVTERQGRDWSGKIKQRRGKKTGKPEVSQTPTV